MQESIFFKDPISCPKFHAANSSWITFVHFRVFITITGSCFSSGSPASFEPFWFCVLLTSTPSSATAEMVDEERSEARRS